MAYTVITEAKEESEAETGATLAHNHVTDISIEENSEGEPVVKLTRTAGDHEFVFLKSRSIVEAKKGSHLREADRSHHWECKGTRGDYQWAPIPGKTEQDYQQ